MGKDKTKDTKDGETVAIFETQDGHWDIRRDHSRDQEARDITLVQTITEAVTWEVTKAHVHYQAILNERGTTCQPALKYLQDHMVLRLWTPSIGQRTNLSTKDGNYGQKRLDSPLMAWREIQKKPRFLTSIIGSMERE